MSKVIEFVLNGAPVKVRVENTRTLLDLLREDFDICSVKEGCGVGVCGSCTVLIDNKPVSSCLLLALHAEGKAVTTLEGIAEHGKLHPIQEGFIEASGFQCGFCTPGMILTAKSLLEENPHPTEEEIRDYMSGNICRCGSYPKAIKAIQVSGQKLSAAAN